MASDADPIDEANIAASQKAADQALTGIQDGNPFDNWVWKNSLDAFIANAGDPPVRAGVLRNLATLPDETVTPSTSCGPSTLELSAGTAEFESSRIEQLMVNATTGVPVSFASGTPGQAPSATVDDQVSRHTLSDVAAGRL